MFFKTLTVASVFAISAGSSWALSVSIETDASNLASSVLASDSGITIVGGSETLIGGSTQQGTYSGFNQT